MNTSFRPIKRIAARLAGLALFVACPAAPAETSAVQPEGRIVGTWVTEPANIADYLTSILFPAGAQCSQFEGHLQYTFTGGEAPTMQINGYGPVVHLERGHSNARPPDRISFGLGISYMSAYSLSADGTILDFGVPSPDVSSVTIDNLIVNEVEVMRESGDLSMLGLSIPFSSSQMRFELVGDDQLKLTPIFPPAPDGVPIEPRPLILRRR